MNIKKLLSQGGKVLPLAIALLCGSNAYAEGSKDLYPNGVTGGRAFLYSNSYTGTIGFTVGSWPFKTEGTHYAYVKAGEILHTASSAQGIRNGIIRLTAPNGTVYTSSGTTGRITNRTAELAGPRLKSQAAGGNRYATYNRTALTAEEGVWKIEFLPTGNVSSTISPAVSNIAANDSWTQGTSSELIAAWDVSVESAGAWVPGRVYTNVMNLHISENQTAGFYGNMYALTKDGYIYKVNNNGNNGIAFTFFINNKGFLTDVNDSSPSYKSKNFTTGISSFVHSPLAADAGDNITHKIFYSQPAQDLPTSANGSVPNNSTWLKNTPITPNASNISIVGAEGTVGELGLKGGYINFTADAQGVYTITIESSGSPSFATRTLTGTAIAGSNKIFWDGKDGNNNSLPGTNASVLVKVQLRGAEVHFPFIDMEINPNGLVLELLNGNNPLSDERFRVYWDDSDISRVTGTNNNGKAPNPLDASVAGSLSGPTGTGGHMWGQQNNNTSPLSSTNLYQGFGNDKSIDTWSYIKGPVATVNTTVAIKKSDLSATANITDVLGASGINPSLSEGDAFGFYSNIWNNGPDAISSEAEVTIMFEIPNGVRITNVSNNGGVTLTYDPVLRRYTGKKSNFGVGHIEFIFSAVVDHTDTNATSVTGSFAPVVRTFTASVLRPADYVDPMATNNSVNTPPTDIYNEIALNTVNGGNRNMSSASIFILQDCMMDYIYDEGASYNAGVIHYQNFNTSSPLVKDGRIPWVNQPNILSSTLTSNGGAITNGYRFSPGYNDPLYDPNYIGTHLPTGVGATPSGPIKYFDSHIGDGSYAVVPPAFVRLGWDPRSFTDNTTVNGSSAIAPHWASGQSYPQVYDWTNTYPWDNPADPSVLNVLDMSGHLNGAAFLVKGNVSQSQGIRPFYRIDDVKPEMGKTYTLQLFSYVNYTANTDYMYMDLVDRNTGKVYASAQLKADNPLPGPGAVSFGWVPLKAAINIGTMDFTGKTMDIQIRGNRTTFGHTLIDDIMYFENKVGVPSCVVPVDIFEPSECTEPILGEDFSMSNATDPIFNNTISKTFIQPAGADQGFTLDIYYLDKSFNMEINGSKLSNMEIEFHNQGGMVSNVRFESDDAGYGPTFTNGIPNIWQIGNAASKVPALRIDIDPTGNVTLLGRRSTTAPFEKLKLINGATLNRINWNVTSSNTILATQSTLWPPTAMIGTGYGKKAVPCAAPKCVKPAASGTSSVRTNVGVSTKANVTSGWPEVVPNGYIALESSNAGLVIPHMTTTQRDALTAIEGMLIYNTTENCVQLYRGESPLIDPSRKGWNCLERGCNE